MDAVCLARLQFAFTICFHYLFPALSIGLAWIIFTFQSFYLRTGDEFYQTVSRFWFKFFTISFAVGIATGITMEFQFGMNWANYSRFVGDIFGAPLAAEGILAFFLESSFMAIMIYGANRVSKKVYWFSSLMVAFGSTLSAFWIIAANSWQQTPAGHHLNNGRAELTNFAEALFNHSTIIRFLHVIDGALITGGFFVVGLSAYYLLKKQHLAFAKKSMLFGLVFAFMASLLQFGLGHAHTIQVFRTQPVKLASFEGLWETRSEAPLLLFGIPDADDEETKYKIEVPKLLSYLSGNSADTVVSGLKEVPKEDRPPLLMTFLSFHLMVALGGYFLFISALGLFAFWKETPLENPRLLQLLFLSIPLPFIANEVGWIVAEVGRQPWIVYNLLKTKDAISVTLPAWQILTSLLVFVLLYSMLFCIWFFLIKRTLDHGPVSHSK